MVYAADVNSLMRDPFDCLFNISRDILVNLNISVSVVFFYLAELHGKEKVLPEEKSFTVPFPGSIIRYPRPGDMFPSLLKSYQSVGLTIPVPTGWLFQRAKKSGRKNAQHSEKR